jgi:hypothetical protein
MTTSMRIAPPNSVVLIEDSGGGEIPASMNQSLIAATDSCIAIGCRAEDDADTEITLGPCDKVDTGERPAFEGALQTPNRKLVARTVYGVTLLEMPVPTTETRLRVWVNDPSEPDRIAVGIV